MFPVDRIDLHEAYCRRNIKKCKVCDQLIDINDQEAHDVSIYVNLARVSSEKIMPDLQRAV